MSANELSEIERELASLSEARKLERETAKGIQFKMRAPRDQTNNQSTRLQQEQQVEVVGHTIDRAPEHSSTESASNNQSDKPIGEDPIFQRAVPKPPNNNQIQPGASRLVRRTFVGLLILGAWGGVTAWGLYHYSKDEAAQSKNVRVRTQMSTDLNRSIGGYSGSTSGPYISEDDKRRLRRLAEIDRLKAEEAERNSWWNYLPSFMRRKKSLDESSSQTTTSTSNQSND